VTDAGGTTRRKILSSRSAGRLTRGVLAVVLPFAAWWPVDRALAAYFLQGDKELVGLLYYPITFGWLLAFAWIALVFLLRRVTNRSRLRVVIRAVVLVMIWALNTLLITRLIRPSDAAWRGISLLSWAAVVAAAMAFIPASTPRQPDLSWPEEGEMPGLPPSDTSVPR